MDCTMAAKAAGSAGSPVVERRGSPLRMKEWKLVESAAETADAGPLTVTKMRLGVTLPLQNVALSELF
jgi:hypothetical protein